MIHRHWSSDSNCDSVPCISLSFAQNARTTARGHKTPASMLLDKCVSCVLGLIKMTGGCLILSRHWMVKWLVHNISTTILSNSRKPRITFSVADLARKNRMRGLGVLLLKCTSSPQ